MKMNAKNENIRIADTDCDYVSFGAGREALIMLPGVGDGFKTDTICLKASQLLTWLMTSPASWSSSELKRHIFSEYLRAE